MLTHLYQIISCTLTVSLDLSTPATVLRLALVCSSARKFGVNMCKSCAQQVYSYYITACILQHSSLSLIAWIGERCSRHNEGYHQCTKLQGKQCSDIGQLCAPTLYLRQGSSDIWSGLGVFDTLTAQHKPSSKTP